MESFNIKTLPFAIAAIIFAFLTFQVCSTLIKQIEMVFDINQMLNFFIMLIVFTSITALSIALFLSQTKNLYYRIGLFTLLFLPYASVFLLQYALTPLTMLLVFVLYIAMAYTVTREFDSLYGNQIKTYIGVPARANSRTIIFVIAVVAALVFFQVNNTEQGQQVLGDKIRIKLTNTVVEAVNQYDLIGKLTGNVNLDSPNGISGQFVNTAVNSAVNAAKPQITNMLVEQINAMIDPYLQYIVYISTFVIFSTIAGIASLAAIVTSLLGMLVIKVLKLVGYATEIKQTIEVTRITM